MEKDFRSYTAADLPLDELDKKLNIHEISRAEIHSLSFIYKQQITELMDVIWELICTDFVGTTEVSVPKWVFALSARKVAKKIREHQTRVIPWLRRIENNETNSMSRAFEVVISVFRYAVIILQNKPHNGDIHEQREMLKLSYML